MADSRSLRRAEHQGSTYAALLDLAERRRAVDRSGTTDLAEYTLATSEDPNELAAARVVLALEHRESGAIQMAEQLLLESIGQHDADSTVTTFACLRLVDLFASTGRLDEADKVLATLVTPDQQAETADVLIAQANIASKRERHVLAVTRWRRAIDLATEAGDRREELEARCGYAADLVEMNCLEEAEFQCRQVLLAQPDSRRVRVQASRLLGRVLAGKGEIAESLRRIERTADLGSDQPWEAGQIAMARTEALLSCRLLDEAEHAAADAIERSGETHGALARGEALVLRARVAIAARQLAPALRDITAALQLFEDEGRTRSVERTERLLAALDPTQPPIYPIDAILSDTSLIEALYLTVNRCSRPEDTVPFLRAIAPAVHADSARQRVLGLSAAVQLQLISGNIARSHELIDDLLDAGEAMCSGIGSVEMRSKIFFELGGIEHIALALGRHDSPVASFRLLDAVATRVHRHSVAAPHDSELLEQLESLREAHRPSRPLSIDLRIEEHQANDTGPSEPHGTELEFAALEQRIRFLSRRVASPHLTEPPLENWLALPPPTSPTVSFIVVSGQVWRCYGDDTTTQLELRCTLADVDRAVRRFRFTFDLAVNGLRPRLGVDAVRLAGDAVHDLLLADLPVDERSLTLRLHRFLTDVPWRLLRPELSARSWMNPGVPFAREARAMPRLDRVAIIIGPDLGQPALDEADAISAIHPNARVLRNATVQQALEAFEESDLVHLVGHGLPHHNDPLLASVQLQDGPLTAYDLERIDSAPAVVVLAACGVGASGVTVEGPANGSAYGLPGVLLRLGTLAVVASPLWLDNALTSLVMTDLHRALAGGAAPVEALALVPNGDRRRDLTAQTVISMQAGPLVHRSTP